MREYLLSIVAAAFVVSLLSCFPQKKQLRRVLTLCGGLYLMLCLLRPVIALEYGEVEAFFREFTVKTPDFSDTLEENQRKSASIIKDTTREYILDKARTLGAELEAEVTLAALSDTYEYPYHVTLTGQWTQAQRTALTQYISQTLGIPEERQEWKN